MKRLLYLIALMLVALPASSQITVFSNKTDPSRLSTVTFTEWHAADTITDGIGTCSNMEIIWDRGSAAVVEVYATTTDDDTYAEVAAATLLTTLTTSTTAPVTINPGTQQLRLLVTTAESASNTSVAEIRCSNVISSPGGEEGTLAEMTAYSAELGQTWVRNDAPDANIDCSSAVVGVEANDVLCMYTGSGWTEAGLAGGTDNLGNHTATANLNMKTFDITSDAGVDVEIKPLTTGAITLESGGDGQINLNENVVMGDVLDMNANAITDTTVNGNITINPNGTGDVVVPAGGDWSVDASGDMIANSFTGDGSGLTSLDGSAITGINPATATNAEIWYADDYASASGPCAGTSCTGGIVEALAACATGGGGIAWIPNGTTTIDASDASLPAGPLWTLPTVDNGNQNITICHLKGYGDSIYAKPADLESSSTIHITNFKDLATFNDGDTSGPDFRAVMHIEGSDAILEDFSLVVTSVPDAVTHTPDDTGDGVGTGSFSTGVLIASGYGAAVLGEANVGGVTFRNVSVKGDGLGGGGVGVLQYASLKANFFGGEYAGWDTGIRMAKEPTGGGATGNQNNAVGFFGTKIRENVVGLLVNESADFSTHGITNEGNTTGLQHASTSLAVHSDFGSHFENNSSGANLIIDSVGASFVGVGTRFGGLVGVGNDIIRSTVQDGSGSVNGPDLCVGCYVRHGFDYASGSEIVNFNPRWVEDGTGGHSAATFPGAGAVTNAGTDTITSAELDQTANFSLTGTWNFGSADLEIPNDPGPTFTNAGEIALDTVVADWQNDFVYFDGTNARTVVSIPTADLVTPTDNYIIKYDAVTDDWEFEADTGSSGATTLTAGVVHPTTSATEDFAVGAVDNTAEFFFDVSTGDMTFNGATTPSIISADATADFLIDTNTAGTGDVVIDSESWGVDTAGAATFTSVDVDAPASNSGSLVIKEGADKGSNTYTFRGLDAGWTNNIEIVWPDDNAPAATEILGIASVAAGVITLEWEADDGAAGGDSVSIDSVGVVDPDFVSTGDIDFVDTSNTVTANLNAGSVDGGAAGDITDNSVDANDIDETDVYAWTGASSHDNVTSLDVDNINVNLNTISSTAGTDLNITPLAGQQLVLDGTVVLDAGVITGATSVTSTAFVGALTGNADTVTTNANLTGHVTSTGNATVLGAFTSAQLVGALSDEGAATTVMQADGTWVANGAGSVASDTIWDAAGDIVYGTGADTATRLAAGTNGHVLTLAAGVPSWAAAGAGDVTDVFSCATGDCATVSVEAGESLNATTTGTIVATGVDATGAGAITIGSADVTEITINSDGLSSTIVEAELDIISDGLIALASEVSGTLPAASVGNGLTDAQVNNDLTVTTGSISDSALVLDIEAADQTADGDIDWDTTEEVIEVGDDGVGTLKFYPGEHSQVQLNGSGVLADANLTDTALVTWSGGSGNIDATIPNNAINENSLAATITLADDDLISMANINNSDGAEGLILPQNATACSAAIAEGQICWDTAGEDLYIGNDTTAVQMNIGGGTVTETGTNVNSQIAVFTSDTELDSSGTLLYDGTTFTADGLTHDADGLNIATGDSYQINGTTVLDADGATKAKSVTLKATTSIGTSSIATTNFVYISTAYDGVNDCVEVELTDADSASTMPAIGVVTATVNDGDCNGEVVISGFVDGLEIGAFSPGDDLYISGTAGDVTSTPPTGEAGLIQKIAQIVENTGAGDKFQIFGAGRSNAVPNLDDAAIFVGSSGNAAVAVDVTGDVTISNTGVTTIGADTVDSSMINTVVESMYWGAGAISADGTQCAAPTEVTIGSWGKQYAIICTDNDASTMTGSTQMPDGWDNGTVTFELAYIQDAADDALDMNADVAARCVGAGETPAAYGTEVAIDNADVAGADAINNTSGASAVTAAGTCSPGDYLQWQIQLDATGTTSAVATLNFIGVKMEYTSNVGD